MRAKLWILRIKLNRKNHTCFYGERWAFLFDFTALFLLLIVNFNETILRPRLIGSTLTRRSDLALISSIAGDKTR